MDKKDIKKKLNALAYHVTQKKGTEPPFSGHLLNTKAVGIYNCACCGTALFNSEHKYNSGTGWPSFYDVVVQNNIKEIEDYSHGMTRKEIVCNNCGAHLGHIFPDGPKPTGLRYCVNSVSLDFSKK